MPGGLEWRLDLTIGGSFDTVSPAYPCSLGWPDCPEDGCPEVQEAEVAAPINLEAGLLDRLRLDFLVPRRFFILIKPSHQIFSENSRLWRARRVCASRWKMKTLRREYQRGRIRVSWKWSYVAALAP